MSVFRAATNTTVGTIERRLLISYQADPDVIRSVVPAPLRLRLVEDRAVVGICLLRLGQLRPGVLPRWTGLRSENVAHRIGVEHPTPDGWRPGVYIPVRHSTSWVNVAAGGRCWPGVHHRAHIHSIEQAQHLDVRVEGPDVRIRASGHSAPRLTSRLFETLEEASRYYEIGTVGWSPDHHDRLEAMRLEVHAWEVEPFELDAVRSSYFDDTSRFPAGTVTLDSALLMRNLAVSCRRVPANGRS